MAEDSVPSPDPVRKKVDESWKQSVDRERGIDEAPPAADKPAETPFLLFLSGLGMQALLALGDLADPVSGEARPDLPQARYLIDVLGILQEKTKGNLTADEEAALRDLLYELRMRFVEKTTPPPARA